MTLLRCGLLACLSIRCLEEADLDGSKKERWRLAAEPEVPRLLQEADLANTSGHLLTHCKNGNSLLAHVLDCTCHQQLANSQQCAPNRYDCKTAVGLCFVCWLKGAQWVDVLT